MLLGIIFSLQIIAQENKIKIYNPDADAKKDLQEAISQAKSEKKHIFIQFAGKWCTW